MKFTISNHQRALPIARKPNVSEPSLIGATRKRNALGRHHNESQASAISAPYVVQEFRNSHTQSQKTLQSVRVIENNGCQSSKSSLPRHQIDYYHDGQRAVEQRSHNMSQVCVTESPNNLPRMAVVTATVSPSNHRNQVTQSGRGKEEQAKTQVHVKEVTRRLPAITRSHNRGFRLMESQTSNISRKEIVPSSNFKQWLNERYGWLIDATAGLQQQLIDNKLPAFLSVWLKECDLGVYHLTKSTDRAFIRLLIPTCHQDYLTASFAKRVRLAFGLMQPDLALRFACRVPHKSALTSATLALALQQSYAGSKDSSLFRTSDKKLCMELEAIARKLPLLAQRLPDAADMASEDLRVGLLSPQMAPQPVNVNSIAAKTRRTSHSPSRSAPFPMSLSLVEQENVISVDHESQHLEPERHPSVNMDAPEQVENHESKQALVRPSTAPIRRAVSVDANPKPTQSQKFSARGQARSLRSRVSSTNISLRDGRRSSFDRSYQRPSFSTGPRHSTTSLYNITKMEPTFPPLPNILSDREVSGSEASDQSPQAQPTNGQQQLCYICSEQIEIHRRQDWQRHVLEDVRPYQCFEDTCDSWSAMYSSLKEVWTHYEKVHPKNNILREEIHYECPFCQEGLVLPVKERFVHVGRHLECVAFSVVNHQYKQWDFYSDWGSDATNILCGPPKGVKGGLLVL